MLFAFSFLERPGFIKPPVFKNYYRLTTCKSGLIFERGAPKRLRVRFERSNLKICLFTGSTCESAGIVSVVAFATVSTKKTTDYHGKLHSHRCRVCCGDGYFPALNPLCGDFHRRTSIVPFLPLPSIVPLPAIRFLLLDWQWFFFASFRSFFSLPSCFSCA